MKNRVALIIGHSKSNPGAVNISRCVSEYDFNQPLVYSVAKLLLCKGFDPIIVYRDTYEALPGNVNKTGAEIAISFHCNAFDKKEHGTEVIYFKGSHNGAKLAVILQSHILDALELKDRGACERTGLGRGGRLLKETNMPCVIAEPFFIDCDRSLTLAIDKHDELASAYANGIVEYFELSKK